MADHWQNQNQSQPLNTPPSTNYGTLQPGISANRRTERGRRSRQHGGPGFPRTSTRGSHYSPHEHSPLAIRRTLSVVGLKESIVEGWRNTLKRTPSTYDPPLDDTRSDELDDTEAARVNGIRVWYSSFTSIDWLHDAVCRLGGEK